MKTKMPLLLLCFHFLATVAMAQALSPKAERAVEDFVRYREAVLKDVETKLAPRREALIRDLESRMAAETRAGNLNGALAIKTKLDQFKASVAVANTANAPAPAVAVPVMPLTATVHVGTADLEQQFAQWRSVKPVVSATAEAAHTGRWGLHLADPTGSHVLSFTQKWPAQAAHDYVLTFWARIPEGQGRVGLSFYDAQGKAAGPNAGMTVPTTGNKWQQFRFDIKSPPTTVEISIYLGSQQAMPTTGDFDDFSLEAAK